MRVLGVLGSPRANSNSGLLLDQALQAAARQGADVERLRVSDLAIAGCRACDACHKTGRCVIADDMPTVHAALDRADRILLAAPVYFAGFPGPLKNLIDRCQVLWWRREDRLRAGGSAPDPDRRGYLLAVSALDLPNNFTGLVTCARAFLRSIDAPYADGMFVSGCERPGEVAGDPASLERAAGLGRRAATPGSDPG